MYSLLADEPSSLHYPVVDGDATSATIFEQGKEPGPSHPFTLLSVQQRPTGILWMRYALADHSE